MEDLELPNYFQKLIFNQQTAAPKRFRPGPGDPRAPPLLCHWSYTWYTKSHWENIFYLE